MPRTRIHFRLTDEDYDYLCRLARENLDCSLNQALRIALAQARGANLAPNGATVASKLDPARRKS